MNLRNHLFLCAPVSLFFNCISLNKTGLLFFFIVIYCRTFPDLDYDVPRWTMVSRGWRSQLRTKERRHNSIDCHLQTNLQLQPTPTSFTKSHPQPPRLNVPLGVPASGSETQRSKHKCYKSGIRGGLRAEGYSTDLYLTFKYVVH